MPKQKNYAFYSKETNSFKILKRINQERRSTLDVKAFGDNFDHKASSEYFTLSSTNFGFKFSGKENILNIKKDENNSEKSKDKDIEFIRKQFGLTQKSLKYYCINVF